MNMEHFKMNTVDYIKATPFPHAVIDDFFPPELLDKILDEWPDYQSEVWQQINHENSIKWASNARGGWGEVTQSTFKYLEADDFITFLEQLTGINDLLPDPSLHGGGLHMIKKGGKLGIHADFNKLGILDRRINVLIYLNKDWESEYGGCLELHDGNQCVHKVEPIFNRMVIFNTTNDSFHGHPEPLNVPDGSGMARKSLALYYYTHTDKNGKSHNTIYK